MRSLIVRLLSLGLLLFATTQATAETFPYVAYVAPAAAHVHAGPGQAYYATDELSAGMKLEVHREVSGWLAIAPPLGSFCWVPARDVELTDTPDIAQVLSADTVAWIGTRIDKTADHVWQVKLAQGDQVKVLGVKRRAGQNGQAPETWYRIAPPEGEFRWIRAEDTTLDNTPSQLADTDTAEEVIEIPVAPSRQGRERTNPEEVATAAHLDDEPIGTGVVKAQFVARSNGSTAKPAAKPASKQASKPREASAPRNSSPFREVTGDTAIAASTTTDATPRVASLDKSLPRDPQLLLSSSTKFDDRLTELELQLALLAAKEPSTWNLEPLRQQAEQLLLTGQSTLERGRARLVVDKIAQFERLAQRKFDSPATPRSTTIEEVQEPTLPEKPATDAPTGLVNGLKLPEGVSYDGVGWLKPVYSAKGTAPPYALVDIDGKVLQFVTPAPGLNLNHYVKRPIGIFGQKSYLANLKSSHVTASRIVELTKYQGDEAPRD